MSPLGRAVAVFGLAGVLLAGAEASREHYSASLCLSAAVLAAAALVSATRGDPR